jgi:hypothetical protein
MAIRITSKELIKLNDLIKRYYGDEINIYVMHGLIVSYLCSARAEPFEDFLFEFQSSVPVFPMLDFEGDVNPEFLPLFLGKLFNKTVELANNAQLICPLVTTDRFNAKFKLDDLDTEQKRNLLDWYMGYFQGFVYLWDHDAIGSYIKQPEDIEDEFLAGIVAERFVTALNMHYLAAYDLIAEIKPKYKTQDFQYSIKQIKETVKEFPKVKQLFAKGLLKINSRYLQTTSEIMEVACDARRFMDAENNQLISANDSHYTRH